MIKKIKKRTPVIDLSIVVAYSMTGSYVKGQRIRHPEHGMGTVFRIHYCKVAILMDSDNAKGRKRENASRLFLAAKLGHDQRLEANGLTGNEKRQEICPDTEIEEEKSHGEVEILIIRAANRGSSLEDLLA